MDGGRCFLGCPDFLLFTFTGSLEPTFFGAFSCLNSKTWDTSNISRSLLAGLPAASASAIIGTLIITPSCPSRTINCLVSFSNGIRSAFSDGIGPSNHLAKSSSASNTTGFFNSTVSGVTSPNSLASLSFNAEYLPGPKAAPSTPSAY